MPYACTAARVYTSHLVRMKGIPDSMVESPFPVLSVNRESKYWNLLRCVKLSLLDQAIPLDCYTSAPSCILPFCQALVRVSLQNLDYLSIRLCYRLKLLLPCAFLRSVVFHTHSYGLQCKSHSFWVSLFVCEHSFCASLHN